ncbi:cell death-inducing p53-target protein 1-like [Plectropomus leopardus]|uniref:cell death-inducing p53-target protein 1-like n=1 Tax=Plectropomus leopardus TaxID=160734 RepID=UPI001C4CDEC5|nr:cell death-inducing p53-target protein 1-like [Plectropomus leopardus]
MAQRQPTIPPPYQGDQGAGNVAVYNTHPPFPTKETANEPSVFTSGGGNLNAGFETGDGKKRFVSYDRALGDSPGMTTCSSCQQQVMTNVTYKAGTYAWLMCLLFICCGLVLCCCLIPFFMNRFKDAWHTCPRCNKVLHVEKRQCCK